MVGLVFAGGGAKGAYQVGSYLAFKKCHIKIDGIVGTSIGSFNAAMIVSGKDSELYNFWKNVDVGELLNFKDKYVDSINNKELFKRLIYGIEELSIIVKNSGIDTKNIKKVLNEMIDEDRIRNSRMDYGLVTVRLNDLKPLYLFKEDMKQDKIHEYILASCNLPIFKGEKLIDNKIYIDGGFYDNNPINMLLDKDYDKVYSIEINGIGFSRKIKDKSKVVRISPSRFLGSMLTVNKERIYENIKMGYYDTLKVLKKYDGYNFIFKNRSDLVYNILARKIDNKLYKRCQKYLGVESKKDVIIKSLEYVMAKEEYTYYKVYDPLKVIKKIKKTSNKKNFIYEFIRNLKVL